ncbi:MAG: hypothetical protein ACRD26_11785 [Vicinamibacterales bacterium]
MRVWITRPPPHNYGFGGDPLLVGRIYNLDAAHASALLLDGCAEVYDLLTAEERRARLGAQSENGWGPADRLRYSPKGPQA